MAKRKKSLKSIIKNIDFKVNHITLRNRVMIITVVGAVIFLALIIRLFYVMVIKGPDYSAMAAKQQTRTSSIHAQRGRIMDCNGTVLAQSGTSYRVLVNPQTITGDDAESERVRISIYLADILDMSYDTVYARVSRTEKSQLVLKRQVSSDVVEEIEALQLGSVITFSTDYTRYYTNGNLFAQLVGFTGADGEGQTGMEAYLDTYLAGTDGKTVYSKDARGNSLAYGDEQYVAPINGYDVTLTVDANVEEYLEDALQDCMSATNASTVTGIVMDPTTGQILAEASNPTFDLNNPDRSDVTSLMAMSRNRVVTDRYTCGTMFKLITLAIALDTGVCTMDTTYTCTGSMTFRTETYYCSSRHKTETAAQALANDCDCFFMNLALQIGTDNFYDYISAFGFGSTTKSGLPNEVTGEVPHRKYSRQNNLALLGIGKGITTTILQMTNAISACINGGILYQPYVIGEITDEDGNSILKNEPTMLRRVISSKTSETMREIMESVVSSGDGQAMQMVGYSCGGKGGVSPVYDDDGNASSTLYEASYVGFTTVSDAKLICLIYADEPAVPYTYIRYICAPYVSSTLYNLQRYYGTLPDSGRETTTMPDLTGQSLSQAVYILARQGFPSPVYLESESESYVIRQIPAAGTTVTKGTKVILFTSMTTFSSEGVHSNLVQVPNLIDRRRQDAYDLLEKVGLTINYDVTACLGKITAQSIEAGTYVEPGTEVYVTFSQTVPDYRNTGGTTTDTETTDTGGDTDTSEDTADTEDTAAGN